MLPATDKLLRDPGAELVFGLVAPIGADLEKLESDLIDPYEKSQALDLHDDAIAIEDCAMALAATARTKRSRRAEGAL